MKTALLLGASGMVGNYCLTFLLNHPAYDRVRIFVRRKLPFDHPKLEQVITDFDQPDSVADKLAGDDLYCCLGTTRKKAGSKEAFYRVDFTYPVEFARRAADHGAQSLLIVTAIGASARSPFFYSQVKGQVEEAVSKLPFRQVHVFRPSFLAGSRKEHRPVEAASIAFLRKAPFLTPGPLRKYRPVQASRVAQAMIAAAQTGQSGVFFHESDEIDKERA